MANGTRSGKGKGQAKASEAQAQNTEQESGGVMTLEPGQDAPEGAVSVPASETHVEGTEVEEDSQAADNVTPQTEGTQATTVVVVRRNMTAKDFLAKYLTAVAAGKDRDVIAKDFGMTPDSLSSRISQLRPKFEKDGFKIPSPPRKKGSRTGPRTNYKEIGESLADLFALANKAVSGEPAQAAPAEQATAPAEQSAT